MAERVGRVVQRAHERRTAEPVAVRFAARSTGHHRGLANRLQHQPAPLSTRLAHPNRIPPTVD